MHRCGEITSFSTGSGEALKFQAFPRENLWTNLWNLWKDLDCPQDGGRRVLNYVYFTAGRRPRRNSPAFFWEIPFLTSTARGSVL